MKYYFILIAVFFVPFLGKAQGKDSLDKKFTIALNSSLNTEVDLYRLSLCGSYRYKKNKFEIGVGFHPFIEKNERLISGELNYKFFPNGLDKKLNMYFMVSFLYMNQLKTAYYRISYNYLFLSVGYGFQANLSKQVYLGTNFSIGTFTYHKDSETPWSSYYNTKTMFKEFGMNLEFQINIGYRF